MHKAHAALELETARAFAAFRQMADLWEMPARDDGGVLHITLPTGTVTVLPGTGAGTALRVECSDASALQGLRDTLDEIMSNHGVTRRWEGTGAGQRPANLALGTVVSVTRVSPSFTRVAVEGPELARLADGGLHFRILFGPEGADWPALDEGGVTRWPGGAGAWHRPVYTVREIETGGATTRLSFDVFRHDGGRTTEWTDRVQPGEQVALTGPGGHGIPEPTCWIGLVGDETAVPAIARILAALPEGTRGEAILFVPESGDMTDLPRPSGVSLRWIGRDEGVTPLQAMQSVAIPESDRHVLFAGEKSEALAARAWLQEQGLTRGEFLAATYWIRD